MKHAPKNLKPTPSDVDSRFVKVIHAFGKNRHVTTGGRKGFGSGALKVNGKIFAMMSSRGEFVVKLPRARVDELVGRGEGKRFDAGRGRQMKEWFVVGSANTDWVALAKEAYRFTQSEEQ